MNASNPLCISPLVVALTLMVWVPFADAQEDSSDDQKCTVQAIEGGVACIAPDGSEKWKTHHPALWSDKEAYLEGEQGARPVEPVTIDNTAFYAIARDLVEVDVTDGIIQNRVRFPDNIAELMASTEGMLDVELEAAGMAFLQALAQPPAAPDKPAAEERTQRDTPAADRPVPSLQVAAQRPGPRVVTHQPGSPGPPRQTLTLSDILGQVATSQDAQRLLASAGSDSQAIDLLESAQKADPTNPFLSQLLGSLLEEGGDEQAAIKAFAEAANSPDAPWQDLLHLSGLLEGSALAPGQADEAYRMGMEQMKSLGLAPENLAGLLPMITTVLGESQDLAAILSAIESGNIDEAIRLGMEIAENLPDVASLNQRWQAIADENEAAAFEIIAETLRDLDCAILIAVGLSLALLLLVLLVGMRAGFTKSLCVRDLLVPLAIFAFLMAIPYYVNTHAMVAQEVADMPIAELQSGLDSPEGQQWILTMAENPDVQQLLASMFAGPTPEDSESVERVPLVRLLIEDAYSDAEQAQWELLRNAQMPDMLGMVALLEADEFEAPDSISLAFALVPLLLLVMLGALGFLLGKYVPSVAKPVLRFVPGGPTTLAVLGAVMLVVLVLATLALLGFDTVAQQLAIAEIQSQLGIEDVDHLRSTPSRLWAWIALAIAVAVHGAIVAWEISR